jgi:hypothetical protein
MNGSAPAPRDAAIALASLAPAPRNEGGGVTAMTQTASEILRPPPRGPPHA